jgi:hypothetical protein
VPTLTPTSTEPPEPTNTPTPTKEPTPKPTPKPTNTPTPEAPKELKLNDGDGSGPYTGIIGRGTPDENHIWDNTSIGAVNWNARGKYFRRNVFTVVELEKRNADSLVVKTRVNGKLRLVKFALVPNPIGYRWVNFYTPVPDQGLKPGYNMCLSFDAAGSDAVSALVNELNGKSGQQGVIDMTGWRAIGWEIAGP